MKFKPRGIKKSKRSAEEGVVLTIVAGELQNQTRPENSHLEAILKKMLELGSSLV